MHSYYEINVAIAIDPKKNDGYKSKHLFATAPRSITDKASLKKVLKEFVEKFPEPQYSLTVVYYGGMGECIDIKETLGEK